MPLLSILLATPVFGAIVIFATNWDPATIRRFALGMSVVTLAVAVCALAVFMQHTGDLSSGGQLLTESHSWVSSDGAAIPLRLGYKLGLDGISMPLMLMTLLLTPLAIWASFTSIQSRHREYYALMLLLFGAMLGVFCARDLLLFYVCFEFTLIPLYFLIGIWGGSERQKAANMFFLYTLAGSMLTFAGVLYLGWKASSVVHDGARAFTFDFDIIYMLHAQGGLSATEQWWLFVAFFAGFAIKVPLFPFHTWLPLAHVEAPTAGSVILAAVLLKLGTYGFLRVSMPVFPNAAIELGPVMGVLAVVGVVYGALAAWVQTDVKRLVAYSSVSHLGFCLLGMFCMKMAGLTGSVLYMVNHGLSTGALFLIVGMIYERYHTREMDQIGGLARKMPIMAFFLVFFTMSSIGLPGLNGFVSEFLVLIGTFISGRTDSGMAGPLGVGYAIPAATGILLGAIYMLYMVRRVLFGPVKEPGHGYDSSGGLTQDLTRREVSILAPIALACIFLGVYPKPVIDWMEPSLSPVLERVANVHMEDWHRATAGVESDDAAYSALAVTLADSADRSTLDIVRRDGEAAPLAAPIAIHMKPDDSEALR
ncbi:MAG: NADH-quinone oxidoreductase subunit M [Phycisphaerales bacterium]|nr:NADH-quinone oxidoreductase subunit M [Phycisphaerales bacterium]MCB9857791.1 NADH-quinone oxidoreductase subunit M [Phycisphaerales bacterium]MCB9863851.1 NADH-quinone oxidoreductase subunit M [Phycisphaerales bacterium]